MKHREENPGGGNEVITLLIVAGGAYLAYNYLQSSGLWAQWFGGAGAVPTFAQVVAGIQNGTFSGNILGGAGTGVVLNKTTGQYFQVNVQAQTVSGPITAAQAQAIISAAPGSQPAQVAQPGTAVVPITNPNTATTPPASNIATQLQSMGNQYMANTGAAGLNVDQWLYYYDIVAHGANPANPASFPLVSTGAANSILAKLGIGTDNTSRAQIVTSAQFLTALSGAGLSGIVTVPNLGPITAPLPTSQNFNRGYGGYPGGRRAMRKGYLN